MEVDLEELHKAGLSPMLKTKIATAKVCSAPVNPIENSEKKRYSNSS